MTKLITLVLILISSLNASNATQNELNDIYMEAVLFVAVFTTMGIISFIYSKKHAKEYNKKEINISEKKVDTVNINRIAELSKMLKDGLLTKKEFELLNKHYLSTDI